MSWLNRNALLLIGGIVLLPLSAFVSLMNLGFGVGFADNKSLTLVKTIFLASYVLVFCLSLLFALKRSKSKDGYGYWDILPIFYFVAAFMLVLVE